VSHTAIIENKRLGHALAIIKAQQDLKYVPKVKTNSEKIGYQKRVRNQRRVGFRARCETRFPPPIPCLQFILHASQPGAF
jgi:hypothetical protein